MFEDRDVTMVVGEGEDCGVVAGVEAAVRKCKKGEKARLVCRDLQPLCIRNCVRKYTTCMIHTSLQCV